MSSEALIPKVIHYCWFGGKPLTETAQKCIASRRKHCPDHTTIEWNETNFDPCLFDYTREAYNDRS